MGFRVVFTGSLGGLTRSKAQELAKKLGAKATPGSVSKSTDLVVFGDKGGKKLAQARELGIATLEAQDFVKLAIKHGYLDDTED
jgi:DNA ligase (NAD+)